MRVRITEAMVSDRGALSVGDEVTIPDAEALEWIRLGRAEPLPADVETATARAGERAISRPGRGGR